MAKAQGRGSAEWMVAGLLVAVHCCSLLASATTWTVGGSQGWIIGPNYTAWAAGQSYTTGDILFFPYSQGAHDVVEVNQADYDACSVTDAIATYADGNTNVTLTTAGTHYFLCSITGHCTAGMKLAVTVGAGATPAPAPSTPAPATTPTSASTPPLPSPASVGTPSSAPVPSPASVTPSAASVPSPASVGTPASASASASAPTPSSPLPSVGTPTGSTPPPPPPPPGSGSTPSPSSPSSPAPCLPSSASLAAALLCLAAALFAL